MSNIEFKEQLLSSVISGELEHIGGKAGFWQIPYLPGETLWQSNGSLTLKDALSMFDPEGDDFNCSTELKLLYGIAWEFVWGKKPPEIVEFLRDEIITKARCGLKLNDLEKLWYNLVLVDTDMF